MFNEIASDAVAVEATVTHSRWTPGQPGAERGKAKRYVSLMAKVAPTVSEWRKVELTFARENTPEFTRRCKWVAPDDSKRDAGEWFHLARSRRLVGEFKRRLEYELGHKLEYFKAAEFQEDGWLHYHVLIRVEGRRGKMIGKHLLQRLWGWGVVWERPVDGAAVSYAAKGCNVAYASKGTEKTPPDYMRPLTSATKLTSTSRGFWDHVTDQEQKNQEQSEALDAVDDAAQEVQHKPQRKRHIPTIGELLDDPRMGLRTTLRITDGSTGEVVTREVKGGDIFTLSYTLKSIGWHIGFKGLGGVLGDRETACAGGAAAPHPSLVKTQHCGVMSLIHHIAASLRTTELMLRGSG